MGLCFFSSPPPQLSGIASPYLRCCKLIPDLNSHVVSVQGILQKICDTMCEVLRTLVDEEVPHSSLFSPFPTLLCSPLYLQCCSPVVSLSSPFFFLLLSCSD